MVSGKGEHYVDSRIEGKEKANTRKGKQERWVETDCDKSDNDKWEDNIKISGRLVSMGEKGRINSLKSKKG